MTPPAGYQSWIHPAAAGPQVWTNGGTFLGGSGATLYREGFWREYDKAGVPWCEAYGQVRHTTSVPKGAAGALYMLLAPQRADGTFVLPVEPGDNYWLWGYGTPNDQDADHIGFHLHHYTQFPGWWIMAPTHLTRGFLSPTSQPWPTTAEKPTGWHFSLDFPVAVDLEVFGKADIDAAHAAGYRGDPLLAADDRRFPRLRRLVR